MNERKKVIGSERVRSRNCPLLAHAYVIPAYHFHMWPLKSLFANSHRRSDSILPYTCLHACRDGHDRNLSFCDMKNEWSLKLKLICIFNEAGRKAPAQEQVFRKCTRPSTSWRTEGRVAGYSPLRIQIYSPFFLA